MLLGAVLVVVLAFTAWQGLRARTALLAVASDFETIGAQLTARDLPAAEATLPGAQEHAARAHASTRGPVWWLAAHLPGIGADVDAVRVVAAVADGLAADALPDVVTSAGALDPARLRPVDGRVDLDPLRDVAPGVVRAAETMRSLDARAAVLEPDELMGAVAGPVADLQVRIAEASSLADRASRAVRLLPPMLGGDGPRTYVLMFQNNAETRSMGGIPGAFALLRADDGRLRLGPQSDAFELGRSREPVLPLTDDELRLFGDKLGRLPQDVTLTPDFPRVGELVRAMWQRRYGLEVDGVVSTDPVALSHFLQGTGPVEVGGVSIGADNAVQLLLSDVYADISDTGKQNRFFNGVARAVFGAVVTGAGDAGQLLDGLTRSVTERRTVVWSADADEQALLAPTTLAGAFPQEPERAPQVGVYLNAFLAYKLDFYLDHEADVEAIGCVGGRQRLRVTVRLSSSVPDPSGLTDYVAPERGPFDRGSIAQTMYLTAPIDGKVISLRVDGQDVTPQPGSYGDRPVTIRSVVLAPGESRRVVWEVEAGARPDR